MASVNLSLTEDCRLLTYHITAPVLSQGEGDAEAQEENPERATNEGKK